MDRKTPFFLVPNSFGQINAAIFLLLDADADADFYGLQR